MAALYVDSLAVAVRSVPRLRPSAELPRRDMRRQVADLVAHHRGIPPERMSVRLPADGDAADAEDFLLTQRVLTALGPPPAEQTLYVVRSGPLLDPMLAPLPAVAHALGWPGDELGVSHLDEQGGTLVFDLLDWAVPDGAGATVVIQDDPAYVDGTVERPAFAAVALRLGPAGSLRVHACGEGLPRGGDAERYAHTFSGARACDAWLGLHAALSSGAIRPGEYALLHAAGEGREAWVLVEAVRPDLLRTATSRIEG